MGVPGTRVPVLEVFKHFNYSRHVGYQPHSVLSYDNEYRVAKVYDFHFLLHFDKFFGEFLYEI